MGKKAVSSSLLEPPVVTTPPPEEKAVTLETTPPQTPVDNHENLKIPKARCVCVCVVC